MSKNYYVRKMNQNDEPNWTKMWDQYIDFYQANISDEVTKNTFNKLLNNNDKIGCLLACEKINDNPVGFLTYVAHDNTWKLKPVCYLSDLFVSESHRQGGIATLLLNQLKNLADSFDWSKIYWLTKPDNLIARKLYDKVAQGDAWIEYVMK